MRTLSSWSVTDYDAGVGAGDFGVELDSATSLTGRLFASLEIRCIGGVVAGNYWPRQPRIERAEGL